MRSFATVGACLAICINLTACDSATQRHYRSAGIGTELYTSELPDTTKLLDDYVDYICDQAGLNAQSCAQSALQPANWSVFVQAGMNDIDRRCDSYLSWLDDQKRSKQPILQQIADSNVATQMILAEAGVGAAPMAIVGAAFGFARHTFTNIQSRLIMEINTSSVQSLVLSRQKNYRLEILGDSRTPGVRIPNKPMALHALRSYLRICMPFTIETEINTTLAAVDRGDPNGVFDSPMIDPRTVGSVLLPNSTTPFPPPPPKPKPELTGGLTDWEKTIFPPTVTAIQKMLCVVPTDGKWGALGSPTRLAMKNYFIGREQRTPRQIPPDETADRRTGDILTEGSNETNSGCRDTAVGFANAFEVGRFGYHKKETAKEIKKFQVALNLALRGKNSATVIQDSGVFDDPTRKAIAEYRGLQAGAAAEKSRELDPAITKLIMTPQNPAPAQPAAPAAQPAAPAAPPAAVPVTPPKN
jgi:hypothetical protein